MELTIDQRLQRIERLIAMQTMEMWSATDLAILLNCSLGHIYNLVNKNEIPYYKSNGSLKFKKSEIETHFAHNPIPSNSQLLSQAITYTKLHKKN